MTSVWNLVATAQEFVPAKVGDGATVLLYTDRHAATVIEVSKSGKTIKLQEDEAKRVDQNGMSESQTYEYSANPTGTIHTARLTKRGWRIGGQKGMKVWMGERDSYHDYSF